MNEIKKLLERLNETLIFPTDFSAMQEIRSPSFSNYLISDLCCSSFSSSHFPLQLRNLRSHSKAKDEYFAARGSFIFTNLIELKG